LSSYEAAAHPIDYFKIPDNSLLGVSVSAEGRYVMGAEEIEELDSAAIAML
jgi:hypothetical protein